MATNTTRAGEGAGTARFSLGPNTRVVTEDGRDVEPGSGERGHVALRGFTPVGYYKDPEKSAATFQVIDGVRYSIPGDWAEVEADGTVKLLGRGSQCINTGGEKVYPEEVEEALKLHPSVHDAAVVGVPDDRFGEAITALVEPNPGATTDEAELIAHVKAKLAAFKAPKRVLSVSTVARARQRQARLQATAIRRPRTPGSDVGVHVAAAGVASTLDRDVPTDRLGRLRRRAVRPRRRDHADRRGPRARVGRVVQRLRVHAGRLPRPHRRPAALRRRPGVPPLTRHRAAGGAPDRPAGQPHDLRDGQPQERPLQRVAGPPRGSRRTRGRWR